MTCMMSHTHYSESSMHKGAPKPVQRTNGEVVKMPTPRKSSKICFTMDWEVDVDLLTPANLAELLRSRAYDDNNSEIVKRLEEVAFYYVQAALNELTEGDVARLDRHQKQLYQWMQQQLEYSHAGTVKQCPTSWLSVTAEEKDTTIALCRESGHKGKILCDMGDNLASLMRKEVDVTSVTHQKDLQPALGSDIISAYAHLVSHKSPGLKILEIASGTGGIARPLLEKLGGLASGIPPRFSSYDFTDLSDGLLEVAQEKLRDWGNRVSYKALDISKDPRAQGFQRWSYDMIVVSIHSTNNIKATLQHMRMLLKPGGKLAVVDITNQLMSNTIMFGSLLGWSWSATGKHSEEEWNGLLTETGFSGIQLFRPDTLDSEYQSHSVIISAAAEKKDLQKRSSISPVIIITPEESSQAAALILRKISETFPGPVQSVSLDSIPDPTDKVCMFLTEIEGPMMHAINEKQFESIKQAIINAKGVFWVGRGGTLESPVPESNLVTGLGRTIRRENPTVKFITLDLDLNSTPDDAACIVHRLFSYTMSRVENLENEDFEYASRNGNILIPRIQEDRQTNDFIDRDTVAKYDMNLDKDASYLLIGGLGGLGRSLGAWMASHGAKHLIFLSRSGDTHPEAREATRALSALGVHVTVYNCDVGDQAGLTQTIVKCRQELPPIKGVIHGGMVLRNSTFRKMSHSDWEQTLRPKISGTKNLCQVFSEPENTSPLDFFIILSSSVGVIGNFGQGNYAASSTFQDAIAHHYASKSNDLPIVTIDLGMILGAGYVAENSNAAAILKKLGIIGIKQEQFLSMIKAAILEPRRGCPRCQIMAGLGTKTMVMVGEEEEEKGEEVIVPFYFQDTRFSHLLQMHRRMMTTSGWAQMEA